MRIHEAAELYFAALRARRASSALVRQTRHALKLFSAGLGKRRVFDLRHVHEAHLVAFARTLRESQTPRGTTLAAATQAGYLQRIKSLFAFLARTGVLLRDPAADLRLPAAAPLPGFVPSERQAARLVTAPSPETKAGQRDRAILELLYGTAIRRTECVRLDVDDVDLRQKTLLVRCGKGGDDRLLPVPKRAAVALIAYLDRVRPQLAQDPGERALFLTAWRGRRLGVSALVERLRVHARAAGIPRMHLHALRHACATHLLRGGADVRHVQAILGHKHIRTTALYTRVAIQDLHQVMARCHPRQTPEAAKR